PRGSGRSTRAPPPRAAPRGWRRACRWEPAGGTCLHRSRSGDRAEAGSSRCPRRCAAWAREPTRISNAWKAATLSVFPRQKLEDAWYGADPGSVAIHPGDILAGYRVTRLLGRGGMGEVWAAVGDQRDVAIKVLLARAAMKPDLVRRFEREAKIASAIQS